MNAKQSFIAPLKIAVVGLGGIGSAFAFQLARQGGHTVTAVARPGSSRLKQVRSTSGIVNTKGETAEVIVTDALDETIAYDLVIVTLLSHQVSSILPTLQKSLATSILFMFNNFEPESLRDAIGHDRCVFGMPFIQSHLESDGRISAVIGAMGQKTKISEQRWVDMFAAAGIPATLEKNMMLWLRCHVPLCIAFESVSVAGVRRNGGATWKEAVVIAHGVHESFRLIRGMGFSVYPSTKRALSQSPILLLAGMLWLISRVKSFRELLATGMEESRALADNLIDAAKRSTIPISTSIIEAMKP